MALAITNCDILMALLVLYLPNKYIKEMVVRKVARISKMHCEGIETPIFVYNRHNVCKMFTGSDCEAVFDGVLAYAKADGCTHYSPDRT